MPTARKPPPEKKPPAKVVEKKAPVKAPERKQPAPKKPAEQKPAARKIDTRKPAVKRPIPKAKTATLRITGGGEKGKTGTAGGWWTVKASREVLGGVGACRAIQADGYSELSTNPSARDFHALGGLPCLTAMRIQNPANGKEVVTVKQDVGAGSSFHPVMGLYPGTLAKLGLSLSGGEYTVRIRRADDQPLHPTSGTFTGSPGEAGKTPAVPQFYNPLRDCRVTPERIDQGVDYAGTGTLLAIADGHITENRTNGWGSDGNYVEYEITQDGPLQGVFVYYAEGVKSGLTVGHQLKGGDQVASLIPGWHSGIEIGQAAGNGTLETWANVYGGGWTTDDDRNSYSTRSGVAFSNLIGQLGGPRGIESSTLIGEWPRWASGGSIPSVSSGSPASTGNGGPAAASWNPAAAADLYSWWFDEQAAWQALKDGVLAGSHHSNSAWDYVRGKQYLTMNPKTGGS